MSNKRVSINFWPGYVAVMACLLQSLVVICGVFALVILALSSGGGAPENDHASKDMQLLNEIVKFDILRLKFSGTNWTLDEKSEIYLIDFVKKVSSKRADKKILLWINTDKSGDSAGIRLAYLRLLAVRNLIERYAPKPSLFEYRIFNAVGPNFPDSLLHIGEYSE